MGTLSGHTTSRYATSRVGEMPPAYFVWTIVKGKTLWPAYKLAGIGMFDTSQG